MTHVDRHGRRVNAGAYPCVKVAERGVACRAPAFSRRPEGRAQTHQWSESMKAIVIVAVAALGLGAAGVASASEDLAKSAGCATCHATDAKKMGPSYKYDRRQVQGQGGRREDAGREPEGGQGPPGRQVVGGRHDDAREVDSRDVAPANTGSTRACPTRRLDATPPGGVGCGMRAGSTALGDACGRPGHPTQRRTTR